MNDASERWDAGPGPNLEPTSEDRGHAAEAPPSEKVREMSDPDGERARMAREGTDGEGGRERAGSAHSEPLADR